MANNQKKKNENEKVDGKTMFTRILCLVLAALMLGSGFFMILEFLL